MPNYERSEILNRHLGAMAQALRDIARYSDCMHSDHPDDEPPCSCPVCVAKRALATETSWRYIGNHVQRLATSPREAKIMEAWKRYFSSVGSGTPDHQLSQIIGMPPTVRDWLVASTVVQWLATNVGQCILSEADYHHIRPEDRTIAAKPAPSQPGELSPKPPQDSRWLSQQASAKPEDLVFNVQSPGDALIKMSWKQVFTDEMIAKARQPNKTKVVLKLDVHEDGGITITEDFTKEPVPPPSERITEPGKRSVPATKTEPESTRESLMMEVFQDFQRMIRTEGVTVPQDMPWYNQEGIVGMMLSPAVLAKLHRLYPGIPYPVHTIQLISKLFKEVADWLDATSITKR